MQGSGVGAWGWRRAEHGAEGQLLLVLLPHCMMCSEPRPTAHNPGCDASGSLHFAPGSAALRCSDAAGCACRCCIAARKDREVDGEMHLLVRV